MAIHKKYLKIIKPLLIMVFSLLILNIFIIPIYATEEGPLREEIGSRLFEVRGAAGFSETKHPAIIAGKIINFILTILGIVFIGLILYGGFQWMTAGGNEEKIKKAKTTLTRAIIGLVIVLAAYSISQFVISRILEATGVSVQN